MTSTYQNVFGGTVIYPSDVSYRAVSLTADTELSWPTELATDTNVVAQIMNVTADAGPFNMVMPAANLASVGQTTLIFNVGSNDFIVTDNDGNVIVSIAPGLAYQIFLTDNTTTAGVWSQVNYGAGVSSATAGALAGLGIKALGSTLSQSMAVTTISLDYSFTVGTDRSQAFVWTGGAGTLTLPLASDAGNDWFVNLRNNGSGSITLESSGSDPINGSASVIFNPGDSAIIVCSGSAWYTFGFGQANDFAFDYTSIDLSTASTPYTLSGANLNRISYRFSGSISSDFIIIVPSTTQQYWVTNATTGGHSLTIKTAAGTGVTVANGEASIMYCNGTNVVDADTAGVAYPISVANGGTGATNATNARVNLSAAKSGTNADITQLTSLGDGGASSPAITFLSESNTGIYRAGSSQLGIALGGATTATFTTAGLTLATGDAYSINGVSVLSATTLGAGVVNSSLTSVGTLTSGELGAGFTTVAVARGGTGAGSFTAGYLLKGNGTSALAVSAVYESGGNVGIGTSTPAQRLDVYDGVIRVGGSAQGKLLGYSASNAQVMDIGVSTGTGAGTDVGLYNLLLGNLTFGTNNTERVRINGAGDVGIGTSTPVYKLHVAGDAYGSSQIISGTAGTTTIGLTFGGQTTKTGIGCPADGTLSFYAGSSTERMRIDSSGNVGIGTSSPASKLQVQQTTDGEIARLQRSGGPNVPILKFSLSEAANVATIEETGANAGALAFSTGAAERLYIASNGYVGVGTTTPSATLDVAGTGRFSGTLSVGETLSTGQGVSTGDATVEVGGLRTGSGVAYIDMHSTASSDFETRIIRYAGANGALDIINLGTGAMSLAQIGVAPLLLKTSDTERVRISGAGNVGIGTNAPTALLDVASNTVRVRTAKTPASASDTGNAGDICWDSGYVYVCVATNTWKRAALSTW